MCMTLYEVLNIKNLPVLGITKDNNILVHLGSVQILFSHFVLDTLNETFLKTVESVMLEQSTRKLLDPRTETGLRY